MRDILVLGMCMAIIGSMYFGLVYNQPADHDTPDNFMEVYDRAIGHWHEPYYLFGHWIPLAVFSTIIMDVWQGVMWGSHRTRYKRKRYSYSPSTGHRTYPSEVSIYDSPDDYRNMMLTRIIEIRLAQIKPYFKGRDAQVKLAIMPILLAGIAVWLLSIMADAQWAGLFALVVPEVIWVWACGYRSPETKTLAQVSNYVRGYPQ